MPNNLLGDAKVFVANSVLEGGSRFLGSSSNWQLTEGLTAKQLKTKKEGGSVWNLRKVCSVLFILVCVFGV